jgi:hypothetical protein
MFPINNAILRGTIDNAVSIIRKKRYVKKSAILIMDLKIIINMKKRKRYI